MNFLAAVRWVRTRLRIGGWLAKIGQLTRRWGILFGSPWTLMTAARTNGVLSATVVCFLVPFFVRQIRAVGRVHVAGQWYRLWCGLFTVSTGMSMFICSFIIMAVCLTEIASPFLCWITAAIGAMKELVESSVSATSVCRIAQVEIGGDVSVPSLTNKVPA